MSGGLGAGGSAEEHDVARRWLVALDFLLMAEQMVQRGAGLAYGVGVTLADAAGEAVLGLMATRGDRKIREQATAAELLELAAPVMASTSAPLTQSLRTRLLNIDRQRNQVLHQGAEVDRRAAERAIASVRELFNLLPALFAQLSATHAGFGPAHGVATVMEKGAPEIAYTLREAETKLQDADIEAAANQACYALDMALARCEPWIRFRRLRDPMSYPFAQTGKEERDRLGEHEQWLIPLALGLQPAVYRRLRRIVGATDGLGYIMDPVVGRHRDVVLTPGDVRWALGQVAETVYRLWETETLREGTSRVYRMMAARGLIGDTFGGSPEDAERLPWMDDD